MGKICEKEFRQLALDLQIGKQTFLDAYAATSEAKFLQSLQKNLIKPIALKRHNPDLEMVKDSTGKIQRLGRRLAENYKF